MSRREGREARRPVLRALKILLPLIALAVFGSLFVFNNATFDRGIQFDGVELAADDGLRLINPEFTGETGKSEPFIITAASALPDSPDPERVELEDVTGEISLAAGRDVTVSAPAGVILPKAEHMSLSGGAVMTTSDGYRLSADDAALDLRAGVLNAEGSVRAESELGVITSDVMEARRAEDGGEGVHIWFRSRVKLRIEEPELQGAERE